MQAIIPKKLFIKIGLIIVLTGILLTSVAYSALTYSVNIPSSGTIAGSEITAVSGSAHDIQEAVNVVAAAGGGTVRIPAGNYTFNITKDGSTDLANAITGVKIPGGVNVIGAGNNQTVLYCSTNCWNSGGNTGQSMFTLDGSNGKPTRISGIYFQGSINYTVSNGYGGENAGLSAICEYGVTNFRIDHCTFIDFNCFAIYCDGNRIRNEYSNSGVIDHCIIDNPYRDSMLPHNSTASDWALWAYGIGVVGDYSTWDLDISNYLGVHRSLTVYIEDNAFSRCRHAIASNGNGFYVSRYNYFEKCLYGANDVHGNAGNGIGGRGLESYSNTFNLTDESYSGGQDSAFQIRGGGGVCWNNTIILNADIQANPVGLIRDSNVPPYDVEDLFFWDNIVLSNGASVAFTINNLGNYVENVNYFLRAPTLEQDSFSYTPYAYPHPLTLTSP